MDKSAEAAAARAAELVAAGAGETPSSPEAPAAEEPQDAGPEAEAQVEEIELPDDIREDLEDDDEPDMSYLEPEDDEEFVYDEDDGDELAKVKKELHKAKKEAEHFKNLRLKSQRSKWTEERDKFFPYATTDPEKYDSRRAFRRACSEDNETMKPKVQALVAAERAKMQAEIEVEREKMRQQAKEAWGTPTTTHTPPQAATDAADERRPSRRPPSLEDRVLARLRGENP